MAGVNRRKYPKPGWSRRLRPAPGALDRLTIRKGGDPGASPAFRTWRENMSVAKPFTNETKRTAKPKGLRAPLVISLPFVRTTANFNLYGLEREAVDAMAPAERPAVHSVYVSRYAQPDPAKSITVTIAEDR